MQILEEYEVSVDVERTAVTDHDFPWLAEHGERDSRLEVTYCASIDAWAEAGAGLTETGILLTQPLRRLLREHAIDRTRRRGSWAARIGCDETETLLRLARPPASDSADDSAESEDTAPTIREDPVFSEPVDVDASVEWPSVSSLGGRSPFSRPTRRSMEDPPRPSETPESEPEGFKLDLAKYSLPPPPGPAMEHSVPTPADRPDRTKWWVLAIGALLALPVYQRLTRDRAPAPDPAPQVEVQPLAVAPPEVAELSEPVAETPAETPEAVEPTAEVEETPEATEAAQAEAQREAKAKEAKAKAKARRLRARRRARAKAEAAAKAATRPKADSETRPALPALLSKPPSEPNTKSELPLLH